MTGLRIATILAAVALASQPTPSPQTRWSYSGTTGPEHWGELSPEYAPCKTGREQSPVDIRGAVEAGARPIDFAYRASPLEIANNGKSIQVDTAPGNKITVAGETYELVQFHFHHPAEEKIEGRGFDLDAHLVHRDQSGHLAVVAVLMTVGKENAALARIWPHLPQTEGPKQTIAGVAVPLDQLLPAERSYYSYMGSLTTPPCTEGVRWLVLRMPVEISAQQLAAFAWLYPDNARPVQPLHGRRITLHP